VLDGFEQVNLAGSESDLVIGHYADAGSAGQSFFVFGGQWARQWKKVIFGVDAFTNLRSHYKRKSIENIDA
jgi:hypothetical protein